MFVHFGLFCLDCRHAFLDVTRTRERTSRLIVEDEDKEASAAIDTIALMGGEPARALVAFLLAHHSHRLSPCEREIAPTEPAPPPDDEAGPADSRPGAEGE